MLLREASRSIISTEVLCCYVGNNTQDFMQTCRDCVSCSCHRQGVRRRKVLGRVKPGASPALPSASRRVSLGEHLSPSSAGCSLLLPAPRRVGLGMLEPTSLPTPFTACLWACFPNLSKPFQSLVLPASFPEEHIPEVRYLLLKETFCCPPQAGLLIS